MGRNLRPTRVHQTVKRSLAIPLENSSRYREIPPVWLRVMERYPPSAVLARPQPTPLQEPFVHTRQRKTRNLYRPHNITYPEDELRRAFFKDHPWELARPRIAVELDGKDARFVDWSRGLRQPGCLVSGESVVQRQLWLMENGTTEEVKNEATGGMEVVHVPLNREQAYDKARKEFYAIRQKQQIQRRIAAEEARMVGAYFGKNRLEVGMELEDKVFEDWRVWAMAENAKVTADRASAYANYNTTEDDNKVAAQLDRLDQLANADDSTAPLPPKAAQ